ncbi:hypothetical protein M438DRAFT_358101 [Aureobasidium pullulans EXF-150]|uniref:F-box domain-containing protein n=1 Tax=Aureobasidium pullulans EXF-150 TaxID=1043002 RepID=A0A074Y387_AURPU|nr:uncharacterized protein M438DRAFT_358101 [Aureobasidium pullulans EXF-150]KEQ81391.1 hypothetical protein M438DRAFT_358101 [Aureobasidium pullulans EXF-150]
MPDFSVLPAPLTLHILLELPDLKALYAAILASPHIYAVFRLNSRRIFKRVVARTLPARLVSPVLIYMLLRERLVMETETMTMEQMQATIDDVVSTAATNPWPQISHGTIFHTVAEAVRIHDIAFFILRSKLDYFGTLVFEKLANPNFRYRGPYTPRYNPEVVLLNIRHPLSDPSWAEETRAIRVLWLLAAGWRASQVMMTPPNGTVENLTQPQRALVSLEDRSMMALSVELARSFLLGPVLLPPTKCNRTVSRNFDVLQNYPVRCATPILLDTSVDGLPTVAQFASIPALPVDTSYDQSNSWGDTIFDLLGINRELLYTRIHRRRLDGPLQDSRSESFDCLGFGLWDTRRTCFELRIRSHTPPQSAGSSLNKTRLSRSEQVFRLYKLYEQQEQREQQGWHR